MEEHITLVDATGLTGKFKLTAMCGRNPFVFENAGKYIHGKDAKIVLVGQKIKEKGKPVRFIKPVPIIKIGEFVAGE